MHEYETYQRSDTGGRERIFRQMVFEHNWMMQTIQNMAIELDELKPRKGVPNELKVMQLRSKPPNFIA